MDAIILYDSWNNDIYTKNIKDLFYKPDDINIIHSKEIIVTDITILKKNIIIRFKYKNHKFILECRDWLDESKINDLNSNINSFDIYNYIDKLKVLISLKDDEIKTIYCRSMSIIDESMDCSVIIG